MEYAPVLVKNPGLKVTFQCERAAPMDLIRAVGEQTRDPIGVVLGEDPDALSRPTRSYDVRAMDAKDALVEAIQGTGYSLEGKNGVMELIAPDVTQRQEELLTHRFSSFGPLTNATMVEMGAGLTEWLRFAVDPAKGFGASIGGALNDERFTLKTFQNSSTEEIADRIVSLGSKGMWIFRADASSYNGGSTDEIDIEPYQHYSNRPYVKH